MKFTLVSHSSQCERLLLLFAGWSAEPEWFEGVQPEGYDLMVANDYRLPDIESTVVDNLIAYKEIVIVAWSFGVPAATLFIRNYSLLPITLRIAINGTLMPVDDDRGIPEQIFEGTLKNLSPATLKRFDRRMCGRNVELIRKRGIEELADELISIRANYSDALNDMDSGYWDVAVISDSDNIIPSGNQQCAWTGHVATEVISAPHFPDFKSLLSRKLLNKDLVAKKFAKSAIEGAYNDNASVQGHIALQLSKILSEVADREWLNGVLRCLEIGTGTGMLTRLYYPALNKNCELIHCDLSHISETLPGKKILTDAETYIRSLQENTLDIILGASVIQWFHSPLRFIEECHRVLKPGGIILLSTFSPDNFPELAGLLNRRLCGPSCAEWDLKLNRLFSEHSVEEESVPLHFTSPRNLLTHMRTTGVNGLSTDSASSQRATRAILREGVNVLTYRPIYLYARKQ